MIYVVSLGIAFIVVFCFMVYYSSAPVLLKMTSFSSLLLAGIVAAYYYIENMGAPIHTVPEGEFVYIHHIVDSSSMVTLWISDLDLQKHRLYTFKYDRETAKKLEEAQGKNEAGSIQQITIGEDEHGAIGVELDTWKGPTNVVPKIQN